MSCIYKKFRSALGIKEPDTTWIPVCEKNEIVVWKNGQYQCEDKPKDCSCVSGYGPFGGECTCD